ncbi:MAG: hypothetical protein IPM66_14795 [Acidobacteriota bacterium]|nr:MAG: hypothetical protein IPM66_14795 [Acidobacteriota bacterium]
MSIEGKWRVRYALQQTPPFINEEGDTDESGIVILRDGQVKGNDPWGSEYHGNYLIENDIVKAIINVSTYENGTVSIFNDLSYPFSLTLNGRYNGTDHFSMNGHVVDYPDRKIVLNLMRVRE